MLSCCKLFMDQLNLEEAREAFDRVYQLKPNAYIYQAGITMFYLDDIYAAGKCFAENAQYYEARFGGCGSEERIWRDACELMLNSRASRRNKSTNEQPLIIPKIPELDEFSVVTQKETRKVMRVARDLFDASVAGDHSRMILSRAKLLSIANDRGRPTRHPDPKQWKLNSWYFLGLHYDVLGRTDESRACMKNAVKLSSAGNLYDIIHTLPMLHMSRRDWYDDEDLDSNESLVLSEVEENICDSVDQLIVSEIQDALGRKGLKTSGSKAQVQQRLFNALLKDAQIYLND